MSQTQITERVGVLIRRHRQSRDWGQATLAETIGVSQGVISDWERHRTLPSLANCYRIAGVLDVDLLDVLAARRVTESEVTA